jgi:hypothetical protein
MPPAWYLDSVSSWTKACYLLALPLHSRCLSAGRSTPRQPHHLAPPPPPKRHQARVTIIEETIKKEQRIQRKHLESEVAAGRIAPYNPPPPPPSQSMLETVGLPPFTRAIQADPEQRLASVMSKSMWTCNPGYVMRDGPRMASTAHSDYVWDDEGVSHAGRRLATWIDRSHPSPLLLCLSSSPLSHNLPRSRC